MASRNDDYMEGWQFTGGTASFSQIDWDLSGYFDHTKTWASLPLGINKPGGNKGVFWNTLSRQGHGLCFAPNGTGKGTSVIVPALLTYGGSVFVIDPKGENAWITAPRRRDMGHRVVILDPWDETNRYGGQPGAERRTKFNPLAFIDYTSRSFADDVQVVAEALIVQEMGENNPHWPKSAQAFVAGLIALVKEAYGKRATLRRVHDLATGSLERVFKLADAVGAKLPDSYAVRLLSRFTSGTEEVKGVIATALTQLQFLNSPDLLDAMENDDIPFTLDELPSRPTTVYVVIPPDRLATHARWLRIVLSLAIKAVTRAERKPETPILMIVDEMGTIGPLRTLETGYGLLRGYGIRFFGFLQSLPQLQGDYPKTWRNFMANCAVLQVLGVADMDTANEISHLLGSTSVPNPTSTGQIGRSYTSRPLMFPQELIGKLSRYPDCPEKNEQLVMFMQGGLYAITLQNPYFCERRWRGWCRYPPQFSSRASGRRLSGSNRWFFLRGRDSASE